MLEQNIDEIISLNQKIIDLEFEKNIRERFVLTLSHDLLNPLTLIKSTAEIMVLMADGKFSNVCYKTLALRIIESVNRSDRMIRDLLDASKIKSDGGISIVRKEFDLDKMILDTMESFTMLHGDRFMLSENPVVRVNWDEDAIRRIVENLLTNSIKHGSKDEKIGLKISEGRNFITLAINNKGNHIPTEEFQNLFMMFRQLQQDGNRSKGWGLGLTLVKGLTESHGGRVRVESCLINGITFFVDLPRD